jgi:hypothetical protein
MADFYGSNYPNPNSPTQVIGDHKGARLRCTASLLTLAAAAAANDRVFVARVPSSARMVNIGDVNYAAFGAGCTASLGFFHAKMTAGEATAAKTVLWNAQAVAAAGVRQTMFGVALANLNKRAWQLAGLTADPGGELDIVWTFATASTGAAQAFVETTFVTD